MGRKFFSAVHLKGDEFANLFSGFAADTLHLTKLIGRSAVDPLNRPEVGSPRFQCNK